MMYCKPFYIGSLIKKAKVSLRHKKVFIFRFYKEVNPAILISAIFLILKIAKVRAVNISQLAADNFQSLNLGY